MEELLRHSSTYHRPVMCDKESKMKLEYKEISKAFKEDNKHWNLELPELINDFGEFELPGAFGYSYCKR